MLLKGHTLIVRILVNVCNLEALDDHKISPLFVAAQYGQRECLEILINAGTCLSYNNSPLGFFFFSFCKYRAVLYLLYLISSFFKNVFMCYNYIKNNLHVYFFFFLFFFFLSLSRETPEHFVALAS